MKKIKYILAALVVITGVAWVTTPPAMAVNVFDTCEGLDPNSPDTPAICRQAQSDDAVGLIKTVINILLFVLGIISIIFIIVAGIMYTTSGGNSEQLKKSKDTLTYAIVGVVVALLAYSIVNFVLTGIGI